MASSKQTAANRRNALKSTGPRTPEGKAFSRLNAIRHGLRSDPRIVSRESSQALRNVRERFVASLQPQTAVENRLVDRMARSRWQLANLERTEHQLLSDPANAGIAAQIRLFDMFSRRQLACDRAFWQAHQEFLRSARQRRPNPEFRPAA